MAKRVFKTNLSVKGIENLKKQLEDYKKDFVHKCDLLAQRLAEQGVIIAKTKIAEYDAVYTGELYRSVNYEKGAVIQDGSRWIVYTDCPWAKFVEFGTGITGQQNPHPKTELVGWKYDVNEHGEAGWFYFRDGEWHWTKGLPSRPFMYETSLELMQIVVKTAKEVFG